MKSPSPFMTSKRLVILLGLTSRVDLSSSYASSSLAPHVLSEPKIIARRPTVRKPHSADTKNSEVLAQQLHERRRVTYALGLGKNQPMLGASTTGGTVVGEEIAEEVYQAVQFWTEHEAVRSIPSPYENFKAAEKAMAAAQSKPKTRSGPIFPARLEEDLLSIFHHHGEESSRPTMYGSIQELDLNTPWVEMLIHEQQLKFA
jgi:hypothetical protein